MSRQAIAEKLRLQFELTQKDAYEIADSVFSIVSDILAESGCFSLKEFGRFEVRNRPPRKAKNPATGETIDVLASKTVRFKASPALRRAV